jgi:ATP-binding protein involved in chromosome partitioning
MTIETIVLQQLSHFRDPILGLPLNEIDLKTNINVHENSIDVSLIPPFPGAGLKELIPQLLLRLNESLPNYQINVTVDHFIKAHRTQLPGRGLRGVKNTIAVASGKGGVGKSTVAVNLAVALARAGARVGILDADIYGPSIPLMLGAAKSVEVQGEYYLPVNAHGVQAMSIGYLTQGEPALIWRGPMLAKSLLQMINITLWDELDYLFIDLPPGTGDIQLSLVQKIPLAGAIIVTTPQTVATLDAEKALKMFAKTNIDVLGIIENMAIHICSSCGHREEIFGQDGASVLCNQYACKLLGKLPLHTQIRKECDEGIPTAGKFHDDLAQLFMKIAVEMAIELAKKPLNYADKFPPIVVE